MGEVKSQWNAMGILLLFPSNKSVSAIGTLFPAGQFDEAEKKWRRGRKEGGRGDD
jgi:hypothetical protein